MPADGAQQSLLLTPAKARELIGSDVVSRDRLFRWIRQGKVRAIKDGGRWFLSRSVVLNLAEDISAGRWPDDPGAPALAAAQVGAGERGRVAQ